MRNAFEALFFLHPVTRAWEKWLKGSNPNLSVTFDQKTAAENPEVVHLNVLHPLVRQAANYSEQKEPVFTQLAVKSDQVCAGEYVFAIYKWKKRGVKNDEALVVVSENEQLNEHLMKLLSATSDGDNSLELEESLFNKLEEKHHQKWLDERSKHIEDNRALLEHRINSLTVSHEARIKLLSDKIESATNDKIKLMRESELARANLDFDRRIAELKKASDYADIQATPVVFGIIRIEAGCKKQ